ncbi:glycosyltransferase family 2 protein [Tenacibaculum geojense]|uniref:Glycosyltransferase family 2 protein n=1 Tax=Tenacibaculum geojense TaxID=915352 RepID=A0ABW3JWI0_9FLAO
MNKSYNFVYVVLTYRNTIDLENFFKENKLENSKVIIVNSFYDKESKEAFSQIALSNNADFINVENLGYSYGNNIGIDFALKNYNFEYLIVCNSDVFIQKMDTEFLLNASRESIYAPKIKTLTDKDQNPYIHTFSHTNRKLFYYAVINKKKIIKYIIYFINGSIRRIFNLYTKFVKKPSYNTYSCHGAFIIFGKKAIEKIHPVFYNEMFLFQEEHFLARKAYENSISIKYIPHKIKIKHYEDGSMDINNKQINNYADQSYQKYFDYFFKK